PYPSDTRDAREQRDDLILGELAQSGWRSALRDERVGNERHDDVRAHLDDVVGRALGKRRELLREGGIDREQRLAHVVVPGKVDEDLGRSPRGRRNDFLCPRYRTSHLLERLSHLHEHLPRRHGARIDLHADPRKARDRKEPDRQRDRSEDARERQREYDRKERAAVALHPRREAHLLPAPDRGVSARRTFMPSSSW